MDYLKGHVKDRDRRTQALKDSADRAILLTDLTGVSGSGQVLKRMLKDQGVDASMLSLFRLNVQRAKRYLGTAFEEGITAQDAIDLASRVPLKYRRPQKGNKGWKSDIDKAKQEITTCVPLSMVRSEARFATNAGYESGSTKHYVTVKFNGFDNAIGQITTGTKTPKQSANWMRQQKLKIHCTCKRWNFFFSYLATIGGYNAGPAQRGYPKIRNATLDGCCCKHGLRVLVELQRSNYFLGFLETGLRNAAGKKATRLTKAELEQAKNRRPSKHLTSEERAAINRRNREIRALKNARDRDKAKATHKDQTGFTRKLNRQSAKEATETVAKMFGLSPDQLFAAISQYKAKN